MYMLAAVVGAGLGLGVQKIVNYIQTPEKIQHPFHPDHTLSLLDKPPYESGSFQCMACGWVFSGSTYHCSDCKFDLDPACANSLKPTEKTQQHLSPPHSLIFCELNDEDKNKFEGKNCSGCNQPFKDSCSIYVCLHCHCLLDESCANLPLQIQHPFHPQYPLNLLFQPLHQEDDDSIKWYCRACGKKLKGGGSLIYQCCTSTCDSCEGKFSLDVFCSSLRPTQDYNSHHPHSLILCDNKANCEVPCKGCNQPLKDQQWIYVCLHCNSLLDEYCTEWPSQIEHPFHPQHPLTLLFQPPCQDSMSVYCRACGKELEGFTYHCSECKFSLDIPCSSLRPTDKLDLSLTHPLTLCETKKNKNIIKDFSFSCYACQLPFPDSVYVSLECCFLLHITCANLPREINHQSCHKHPLTLHPFNLLQSSNRPCPINQFNCCFHCNACEKDTIGFAYTCGSCKFYSDIRCTINSALYHKHPLAWFNISSDTLKCDICRGHLHTPILRCDHCNFNIHVTCFPILPQIVQTVHHRHKLTLNKFPMKDHRDESDEYHLEFYCDNCEKPRNLSDYTYYCEECRSHNSSFITHVHCMVSKAMSELVKEWSLDITLSKVNADNEGSNSLKIQEITEEEGEVGQVSSDVPTGNENTSSSQVERKRNSATSRSFLIEIDERIKAIDNKVESLSQKINEKKEEKKELMKQRDIELYGEGHEERDTELHGEGHEERDIELQGEGHEARSPDLDLDWPDRDWDWDCKE